jgi:hypothetical protein
MVAEQAVSGKREALMVPICFGQAGHRAIESLNLIEGLRRPFTVVPPLSGAVHLRTESWRASFG